MNASYARLGASLPYNTSSTSSSSSLNKPVSVLSLFPIFLVGLPYCQQLLFHSLMEVQIPNPNSNTLSDALELVFSRFLPSDGTSSGAWSGMTSASVVVMGGQVRPCA